MPDLFGRSAKNPKSYASFQEVYCSGRGDKECNNLMEIDVKGALKRGYIRREWNS